jgi:hypothetical protein
MAITSLTVRSNRISDGDALSIIREGFIEGRYRLMRSLKLRERAKGVRSTNRGYGDTSHDKRDGC